MQMNKRGDSNGESNDSPEILYWRVTSVIRGLPLGYVMGIHLGFRLLTDRTSTVLTVIQYYPGVKQVLDLQMR